MKTIKSLAIILFAALCCTLTSCNNEPRNPYVPPTLSFEEVALDDYDYMMSMPGREKYYFEASGDLSSPLSLLYQVDLYPVYCESVFEVDRVTYYRRTDLRTGRVTMTHSYELITDAAPFSPYELRLYVVDALDRLRDAGYRYSDNRFFSIYLPRGFRSPQYVFENGYTLVDAITGGITFY